MKRKSVALASLALCVALPACSRPVDRAPREFALTDPTVVISSGSALLALVVDMTIDERGNVLLLDWSAGSVVVVPPDGGEPTHFGGKGQGPGEFEGPSNIGVGDGLIRMIDQLTGRMHRLDYEGRLMGGVDLAGGIVKASVGTERIAYMAVPRPDQPLVTVTSADGITMHRIVAPVADDYGWNTPAMRQEIVAGGIPDQLRNTVIPAVRLDGGVWAFLATEGTLQRYGSEGQLVVQAAIDLPEKKAILAHFRDVNLDAQRRVVFPLEYVSQLHAIGEEVWLLWNVPTGPNLITVHRPDATLLHRLTFAGSSSAGRFAVDIERRRVYLYSRDDSSLVRYALPAETMSSPH